MKYVLFILLFLNFSLKICAQVNCPNFDFSQNNLTGWDITSGFFGNCCNNVGSNESALININYADTNTNYQLYTKLPGFVNSYRVGNDVPLSHADRATYTLIVDNNNALITLAYAIVMENPNHNMNSQPQFTIRLLNSTGNLLDSICGTYNIFSDSSNVIFNHLSPRSNVLWTNWVIQSIDLSNHMGEIVKIEFSTYDCQYGGHYGYAYITAKCEAKPKIVFNYCHNDSIINISAPPNFTSYLWNNGKTTRSVDLNINQFSNISVEFTSFLGCKTSIDTIIPIDLIVPKFNYDEFCDNDSVHFYDKSTTTIGKINKWEWDFGDSTYSTLENPVHKYKDKGSHKVALKVTTNFLCCKIITDTVTGLVSPVIDFDFSPQPTDIYNPIIIFVPIDSNGNIVTFLWNFAGFAYSIQQTTYFIFPDTGHYPVQLLVVNSDGCEDSIIHVVKIDDIPTVYFPSAFTPNNDGKNDKYQVYGLEIKKFKFIIYNKWGEQVFSTDNIYESWDGNNAETGAFVYIAQVVFNNNIKNIYTGNITLVK